MLIYVLLAATLVTLLLAHWLDAGVILGVVVINAIIGFIQEGKAERALDAIRELLSLRATVVRAYLYLGVLEACGAMAAFFVVLRDAGWRYGEMMGPSSPVYLEATTACLSTIIVMQVVNVFLCRSDRDSLFKTGLRGNPLILWGVLVEVALILGIDYTPWGNALFGTAPLPLGVWLIAISFGVLLWILEEMRKWLVRRYENRMIAALS